MKFTVPETVHKQYCPVVQLSYASADQLFAVLLKINFNELFLLH